MAIHVVRCPRCTQIQATAAQILQCKYCGRSSTIRSRRGHQRVAVLATANDAAQAVRLVQELNAQKENRA